MAADGGGIVLKPGSRPEAPDKQDRPRPTRPDVQAHMARQRKLVRWAGFLLLPIGLIVGAYLYVTGGRYMTTDDAYVQADKVGVATDVSGLVASVDVKDNQRVSAGQVLFALDPAPFRYALERTQANLRNVRDEIAATKANYRQTEAQIGEAKDDVAYYRRQNQRQLTLHAKGVASQEALDTAEHNLATAQQKLAALRQRAAAVAAKLDGHPSSPIAQHPLYRQALAQRDEAARQLKDSVVRAPFAGVVTKVPSLQPGMYLKASTPGVSLVATGHVWVEAEPKETALTHVRPGQKATITVDTYPGVTWHGSVASLSPASASEFSLLPAENTSGNWVKVVQRVPMRVRVDTNGRGLPPLRAGMSAEISVDTGHERGLPHFLTALFGGGKHDNG